MRGFALIVNLLVASCAAVPASELLGKVTLDRKMVKKSLDPAVYDLRGIAIPNKPPHRPAQTGLGKIALWLECGNCRSLGPISATMNQRGRHFEPELLIVPAGSKVAFPNLDPIFHNIFSLSRSQSFDLGYYSQGKSRDVFFPSEGIVQVYCHVHPEMYGVIVVASSKWTARPDPDGSFSWGDLPPGKYRLAIWQPSSGLLHKSVTIPPTGGIQVEVKLPEEVETTD